MICVNVCRSGDRIPLFDPRTRAPSGRPDVAGRGAIGILQPRMPLALPANDSFRA
jgi:hypothetical protein